VCVRQFREAFAQECVSRRRMRHEHDVVDRHEGCDVFVVDSRHIRTKRSAEESQDAAVCQISFSFSSCHPVQSTRITYCDLRRSPRYLVTLPSPRKRRILGYDTMPNSSQSAGLILQSRLRTLPCPSVSCIRVHSASRASLRSLQFRDSDQRGHSVVLQAQVLTVQAVRKN